MMVEAKSKERSLKFDDDDTVDLFKESEDASDRFPMGEGRKYYRSMPQ